MIDVLVLGINIAVDQERTNTPAEVAAILRELADLIGGWGDVRMYPMQAPREIRDSMGVKVGGFQIVNTTVPLVGAS